jgi:hypothetical protein
VPPSAEGRWSLLSARVTPVSPTEWSTALAQQLLTRYGVVTREVGAAESIPGGFSAVYDVLRALDESGRVRRGFFVGGVGGDAVRAAAGARSAALAAAAARRARGGDPGRRGSGQPVRHAPEVAGARRESARVATRR